MFGHNDDNNDNTSVALPPMGAFDQPAGAPAPEAAPADDAKPAEDKPANDHRKAAKSGAPTDDLLDIKQDALKALTPLVDHLDQTPEERFRTTMMMIQAADNHSLIKLAYEAAQHISNDKERAQALLDIVNEINYFTQQNQA
ncbi:MAG TPA: hypothetical protein VK978_01120 [Candidatus Saccharimonadales bacterium]|nr:hypothetical protein [Candidatus Saccharimonadales bacterium]